jgi:hypothetical protein
MWIKQLVLLILVLIMIMVMMMILLKEGPVVVLAVSQQGEKILKAVVKEKRKISNVGYACRVK